MSAPASELGITAQRLGLSSNVLSPSEAPTPKPQRLIHRGRTAELMPSRGLRVGYDEPVPANVNTALVVEVDVDGREALTAVNQPGGKALIEVFSAAENRKQVVGVVLLGIANGAKVEQAIFSGGGFDTTRVGQVDIPLLGGRSVRRPYVNGDKSTDLPGGYYTGSRMAS